MKSLLPVLALGLAIATAACGQSMKKPDIKLNPNPKLRYEVTLTIDEDVPGPFESVIAFSYYQTDENCVPMQLISGAVLSVDHRVPVTLHQTAPKTYRGTVYLDLLQDEDYYGLGVCRWSLMSFNAQMKAGEVTFGASLDGKEVATGSPRVQYFPKSYFNDPFVIKNTKTGGMPLTEAVRRDPGKFFSTILEPKGDL
ncbi:hypothetical protein PGB34_18800 [Xenophilus arseniciresistens]|uniref:Lipoprotein n=1 Tax=Xenophilus arseniciresistens TaxID=1283306 RepID=A0AAE3NC09_9BURK|nr:hypothetical protein [Xenophilus arseniciresistens]MDA7418423.1 hypothetical protein [Xenophilus arseniciresistens]